MDGQKDFCVSGPEIWGEGCIRIKKLNEKWKLKDLELDNRICFAPIGPSVKAHEDGTVTDESIAFLGKLAESGTALIFHGSTSISGKYRANGTQCGIWSDEHIPGLRKEVELIHSKGKKIFMQLEHPGIRSSGDNLPCASDFTFTDKKGTKHGREMSQEEIEQTVEEYAQAARRAVEAGYDGLELHASHGWLLSTFLNKNVNKRSDIYGQEPTRIVEDVFRAIKKQIPESMPVGIRMSGYVPTLEEGLKQAVIFEKMGFDFLDISINYKIKWLKQDDTMPEEYPYNSMIYAADEINKLVSIPVFVAKSIVDGGYARAVLQDTDVDMVMIGRGMLADPDWAAKALRNERVIKCLSCRNCRFKLVNSQCHAQRAAGWW